MKGAIAAMDGPTTDWKELLWLSGAAMTAALARGIAWTDPKTGKFSPAQTVQAFATAGTIALISSGIQAKWSLPVPITALLSAGLSLVGLPAITATFQAAWGAGGNFFISKWFPQNPSKGAQNAPPPAEQPRSTD
jgi:hypothetical protein